MKIELANYLNSETEKLKISQKIHWQDIPRNATVSFGRCTYWYNNKLVFWHTHEARDAQSFLNSKTPDYCNKKG